MPTESNPAATRATGRVPLVGSDSAHAQTLHLGAQRTVPMGARTSVDYQVRDARITDVDRIIGLLEGADDPFGGQGVQTDPDAANLLRQLIYLPQAAVLVAESGRRLVGLVVLALRPSVREGGMIGSVDVLAVDPREADDTVGEALLNGATRSARNKGCVVLEATEPVDPDARDRWFALGFEPAGPRIVRPVAQPAIARN